MNDLFEVMRIQIIAQARLWREFRGTQLEHLTLDHLADAVEQYEKLLSEERFGEVVEAHQGENPL